MASARADALQRARWRAAALCSDHVRLRHLQWRGARPASQTRARFVFVRNIVHAFVLCSCGTLERPACGATARESSLAAVLICNSFAAAAVGWAFSTRSHHDDVFGARRARSPLASVDRLRRIQPGADSLIVFSVFVGSLLLLLVVARR